MSKKLEDKEKEEIARSLEKEIRTEYKEMVSEIDVEYNNFWEGFEQTWPTFKGYIKEIDKLKELRDKILDNEIYVGKSLKEMARESKKKEQEETKDTKKKEQEETKDTKKKEQEETKDTKKKEQEEESEYKTKYNELDDIDEEYGKAGALKKQVIREILVYLKENDEIDRDGIAQVVEGDYITDVKGETLRNYMSSHLNFAEDKKWLKRKKVPQGTFGRGKHYDKGLKEYDINSIVANNEEIHQRSLQDRKVLEDTMR